MKWLIANRVQTETVITMFQMYQSISWTLIAIGWVKELHYLKKDY